jgi:hypothetical protein
MRDAPLRRRLGEAARLRARERFGLERMLAAMEALFWQVSETRQHPCAA